MTTVLSIPYLPPQINLKINPIAPSRFSLAVSFNRNVHRDPATPPHPLFGELPSHLHRGASARRGCICTGRFDGSHGDGHFLHARRVCIVSTSRTRLRSACCCTMDPQEEQDMEIEALQAIYLPHEFGRAESNPWNAPSAGSEDEGKQACGDAWTVRVGHVHRSERRRNDGWNGC